MHLEFVDCFLDLVEAETKINKKEIRAEKS